MVTSGLVGFWPLSEWSGRANDISGNDNHGTVNGATQGVVGRSALTAYSFDGSDDYTTAPARIHEIFNSNASASFWFKTVPNSGDRLLSTEGSNGVLAGADNVRIFVDNNNSSALTFTVYDNSEQFVATTGSIIRDDEWHHCVISRVGNSGRIYIDGELEAEDTEPNLSALDTDPGIEFEIMARTDQSNYTSGSFADLRIYNRALSPSEIQHLYEVGSVDVATPPNASDANAVSRWSFDDRSDTSTALDEWSSNDGTINGAVYSSDAPRNDSLSMEFAGGSDAVTIPNDSSLNTVDATISLWVKPENENGSIYDRAINNNGSMRLITRSGGDMDFSLSNSGGTTTVTGEYSLDTWSHQVVTWTDSGTLRIYTNGVEQDSTSIGSVDYNNKDLTIGNRTDTDFEQLNGFVDDVRIYDRALSDYEVQQLYLWGTRGVDRRHEVLRQ